MKAATFFLATLVVITVILLSINENRKRAIIQWQEINMTPAQYANLCPTLLDEQESVIRKAYEKKESKKWKTEYRYAFVIKKANWFNHVNYLTQHQPDAVDKRVIFSNSKPDPEVFEIQNQ
jgi:hypothetical protein